MNNRTIDISIQDVQQQAIEQQNEIYWTEKFYLSYIDTEYAAYFLWHESGQLYDSERLLRLKYRSPEEEPTANPSNENGLNLSPQEARRYFLSNKLSELGF